MGLKRTDLKTIEDILSGSTSYKTPLYQREYSWGDDQLEQMWEDTIYSINTNSEFFFGNFVFVENGESHTCIIVDGQQRLATITILSALIRDIFRSLNDEQRVHDIDRFIADNDIETRNRSFRLTLNKYNQDFFRKYIQEIDTPAKKRELLKKEKNVVTTNNSIFRAYEFFEEKINEYLSQNQIQDVSAFIAKLFKHVTQKFKIVITVVTSDEDAFLVFETINYRGIELAVDDLLKNYLFSKAGTKAEEVSRSWDSLKTNLSGVNITSFLRHYWNSMDEHITERDLYSVLKKEVQKTDVVLFMDKLVKESEVYGELIYPDLQYWDDKAVIKYLEAIHTLNARLCFPLLLSAHRNLDKKSFSHIIQLAINLTFRYSTICNFHNNRLERIYSTLAILIQNKKIKDIKDIKEIIQKEMIYPDDDTFIQKFTKKNIRSNKVAKYILEEINALDAPSEYQLSEKVTLEHILPKKPSKEWKAYFKEETDLSDFINRIGNFTVLVKEQNKKIANSTFDKKKEQAYNESLLPITKELCNFVRWDEASIEKRQAELAKKANNIWLINFD